MGGVAFTASIKLVIVRTVILVLESIPIIGVSIIANYWIIGPMKF